MTYAIDHIVILVYDLERAQADYQALGFTVVEGGRHADGLTHNALVAFEDSSYLELVAFLEAPPEGHPFYRAHGEEGLITYALLPGNIERDIREAQKRELPMEGPRRGGRHRPDGVHIEWQTAWAGTRDLPFLCADLTPRDLRVPFGQAHRHSNGVTGIATVTVIVRDLGASIRRYAALLGTEPSPRISHPGMEGATFMVGAAAIVLANPTSGILYDYLEERGEGPYALALRGRSNHPSHRLDIARTHGVQIEVVPQS